MKKQAQIFLFAALAILSLAACHDQSPTQQPAADAGKDSADATKNWKIGVQMWTFMRFDFVTALAKVDSAGAKYIEAFPGQKLGGSLKGSFGIQMSADDRASLKQLLQAKGISMVAMGVITPETIDEWKKYFDLAKDFGLSYITAEPLKNQWGAVDSLAGLYGIRVAIHDHPKPNVYWSPDSVLAATVGHPHIGSCADVGHWARNGLNPVDCLKKLEGHVFGVHLKDIKVFGQVDAPDTAVGYGVNNFPAIFAELKRQNFNGMLSIEQESNWLNSVPDVKHTIQYYHDQVAKLQ